MFISLQRHKIEANSMELGLRNRARRTKKMKVAVFVALASLLFSETRKRAERLWSHLGKIEIVKPCVKSGLKHIWKTSSRRKCKVPFQFGSKRCCNFLTKKSLFRVRTHNESGYYRLPTPNGCDLPTQTSKTHRININWGPSLIYPNPISALSTA